MTTVTSISKPDILKAIKDALEPLSFINAMVEGGAVAFGREDQYSDIDLYLDVADERVDDAFAALEQALLSLSRIAVEHEVPQPAWHGLFQKFYRLEKSPEWLMIDLAIMKNSGSHIFLEPKIHGKQLVHFDKIGLDAYIEPFDAVAHRQRLVQRLVTLEAKMQLFAHLPRKLLWRQHYIDALAAYRGQILIPLVELIRIKHDPLRYSFSTRYLYYIAPAEVVERYERLSFVGSPEQLKVHIEEAEAWFWELHAEMSQQYLK